MIPTKTYPLSAIQEPTSPTTEEIRSMIKGLRGELLDCRCCAHGRSECCCDTVWPEDCASGAADMLESLMAEVDRLRQQLAEARVLLATRVEAVRLDEAMDRLAECERNADEQATTLHNTICSANRLSEQLASVTKDAERYRFFKQQHEMNEATMYAVWEEGENLDAAIDIALAKLGADKTGEV